MNLPLRSLPSPDAVLFTLADAAKALNVSADAFDDPSIPITGVSVDSRVVEPGDLFVALRGSQGDGHQYLERAVSAGAHAALVSGDSKAALPGDFPRLVVSDTLFALGELARWHRQRFEIPVVAITGSVGKTTTKDMTAGVLGELGDVVKNPGNFNTEIGTPFTLLGVAEQHRALVQEIGMRKPGDVAYLARMLAPDIGVFTNLRESHLEFFGSKENLARSKGELFEALPASGWAVVNGEDPWAKQMLSRTSAQAARFHPRGRPEAESALDVWCEEVEVDDRVRAQFRLVIDGHSVGTVRLPVSGVHHVANALAAATVGTILGVPAAGILRGLERFAPSAMRSECIACGPVMILNDAYNSSPTSCRAALDMLARWDVAGGRRVAILGPMLELGAATIPGHRAVGRHIGRMDSPPGLLITVDDLSRHISDAALYAGYPAEQCHHFDGLDELIESLPTLVAEGDHILVKASRSCRFERLVEGLCAAFGDRREVKE